MKQRLKPSSLILGALLLLGALNSYAQQSTLNFSGYTWKIKSSAEKLMGPGPNYWSADNAFVDAKGYLHLKITKTSTGACLSSQVTSEQTFGLGHYEMDVEYVTMNWNPYLVFGMYNYPLRETGPDKTHEIDIELAQWGKSINPILFFTSWPTNLEQKRIFDKKAATVTKNMHFSYQRAIAKNGDASISYKAIMDTEYNSKLESPYVSKEKMPFNFNFWCFKGSEAALQSIDTQEMIVKSFKYIPN